MAFVTPSEDATVPDSSARSRSATATRRWVERLERFAAGNLTVAAFCTAEGVSQANFYLWRRRLAHPSTAAPNQPKVVPIRVAPPPTPTAPLELAMPSGAVVRFPADARPE